MPMSDKARDRTSRLDAHMRVTFTTNAKVKPGWFEAEPGHWVCTYIADPDLALEPEDRTAGIDVIFVHYRESEDMAFIAPAIQRIGPYTVDAATETGTIPHAPAAPPPAAPQEEWDGEDWD